LIRGGSHKRGNGGALGPELGIKQRGRRRCGEAGVGRGGPQQPGWAPGTDETFDQFPRQAFKVWLLSFKFVRPARVQNHHKGTFEMTNLPPAGWYPDSERLGGQRYWDGSVWTEHRAGGQAVGAAPQQPVALQQPVAQAQPVAPAEPRKKKKPIFLWFFLLVQVAFIVWAVSAAVRGAGTPDACAGLTTRTCNDLKNVGTGLGVFLIVICWMIVDFLLGVGYAIYRLARRP
jgi:Protein of unknown function (DUF2510)